MKHFHSIAHPMQEEYRGHMIKFNPMSGMGWIEQDGVHILSLMPGANVADAYRLIDAWREQRGV